MKERREAAAAQKAEELWIIDPLDGTTNFIHGYPSIGVSIALMERGRVSVACVYDPLREELFEAELGGEHRMDASSHYQEYQLTNADA